MRAEDLRAVAKEIREKADAINNKHLWHRLIGSMTDDHYLASDIAHIAAWHPAVTLAVADWLELIGDTLADDPSDYCAGKGHEMWSSQGGVVYVDCNSWWCANVDKAFAFVKAWRGES